MPASHAGGRWFEPSCLHQNGVFPQASRTFETAKVRLLWYPAESGDFFLQLKFHYAMLTGIGIEIILSRANNFELYFEGENFDYFLQRLFRHGAPAGSSRFDFGRNGGEDPASVASVGFCQGLCFSALKCKGGCLW